MIGERRPVPSIRPGEWSPLAWPDRASAFARGSHLEDTVWLPPSIAAEAYQGLVIAGFASSPNGIEDMYGVADDIDQLSADGRLALVGLGSTASMRLWSQDRETGSRMGFECMIDRCKGIFYAKPAASAAAEGDDGVPCAFEADRAIKSAIVALLDVAESCNMRRIMLGLGAEHAGHAEFICALLYLGFKVVTARKSPFLNLALMLDLDITCSWSSSSDYTDTSDCSTSADDVEETSASTPADEIQGDEGANTPGTSD